MESNYLFIAFMVGWMCSTISMLLGGWIEKVETGWLIERSKRRCSRCSKRVTANKEGITASGRNDEAC